MSTLSELAGTRWTGKAELWLDPLGNESSTSDCTLSIEQDGVRYTWVYEEQEHTGSITLTDQGGDFTDTWHQKDVMKCVTVPSSGCLFNVQGVYMENWGWRIALCQRPHNSEMVLQMTNVTPWGEEGRAVRMQLPDRES